MKRMYLKRMAKLYSVLFFALLLGISACKKDVGVASTAPQPIAQVSGSLLDVNVESIHPDVKEYYVNIAEMADYYGSHPKVAKNAIKMNTLAVGDTTQYDHVNPLVDKLNSIEITDTVGNKIGFFDLPDTARKAFIISMAVVEVNDMSKKVQQDTLSSKSLLAHVRQVNIACKTTMNKRLSTMSMGDKNTDYDPYFTVRDEMNQQEMRANSYVVPERANSKQVMGSPVLSFDAFWAALWLATTYRWHHALQFYAKYSPLLPTRTFVCSLAWRGCYLAPIGLLRPLCL